MERRIHRRLASGFAIALAAASASTPAWAQPAAPRAAAQTQRPAPTPPQDFPSPEQGFAALAAAAGANDEAALLRILGSAGRGVIRSGDAVADRAARQRFATAYAQKAEILRPSPTRAVLQVGDDEWPLPIPMAQRGSGWRFDPAAGTQEIVNRRIGRNELDTIDTLRAVADAQADYARTAGRQGAIGAYARRFFSRPGQRDGLYWPSGEGQPESPLGPFVAAASAGGYSRGQGPEPFHGYVVRILEAQGAAAPGGAMDFVVNGRMIGGFAILAAPAQYGISGVKTFMISHDGVVWEKDLGPDTTREAAAIRAFDPGPGWGRVQE